jgi:dTDP-4-amino-4,6-dideoxygalactose transaminase
VAPTPSPTTIPVMRPWLGQEEADAAAEAVLSGWVAQGPRVREFEDQFALRSGAAHGVAVSSCTAGLHLALVALGIGPGDEVIAPSLSFVATVNAVGYVGATAVFADVDLITQNLTPDTIRPLLTPATRAVILVHQAGVPADIDAVHLLCDPLGIEVVEDAACAVGATYRGAEIGSHSSLVTFSFHPRKILTTGEGGMVVTSRQDWATRLRQLREHGMSASAAERHASGSAALEQYLEQGFNYRMTDLQAAVGLVQLRRLDTVIRRRRELAARYRELLTPLAGLVMAADPPWGTTNYQSFWVLLPDDFPIGRNQLLEDLASQGISARRGIMASHLEPAYAGHPRPDLPVTERLTRQSLILPLYHELTEQDQDRVVGAVLAAAHRPTTAGDRGRTDLAASGIASGTGAVVAR